MVGRKKAAQPSLVFFHWLGPGCHFWVLFWPLGAPGVPSWSPRGPKSGFYQSAPGKWLIFGTILEVFLGSFLDHFSDVFFGGLLASILVNFGAVLEPSGTLKTTKNVQR